jgi:hypothetical protein
LLLPPEPNADPKVRLTVDVPEGLHTRIKTTCERCWGCWWCGNDPDATATQLRVWLQPTAWVLPATQLRLLIANRNATGIPKGTSGY